MKRLTPVPPCRSSSAHEARGESPDPETAKATEIISWGVESTSGCQRLTGCTSSLIPVVCILKPARSNTNVLMFSLLNT